jgi:small-conductance mechanosensitive channel
MSIGGRARALAALLVATTCAGAPCGAAPSTPGTPLPVAAESSRAAVAESTEAAAPRAAVPVFLGEHVIFVVRSPRAGLSPEERAAAIRQRLDAAVADRGTPADHVWMRRTPEGIEVLFGDRLLWIMTAGDIEGMRVRDLGSLVSTLPARITGGIVAERGQRTPLGILRAVLMAFAVTMLALTLALLLRAAARRWRAFLARTIPTRIRGVRIGGYEVMTQRQITDAVAGTLGHIDKLLALLLAYAYLTIVFSMFPWSQGWGWSLLHFAREQVEALGIWVVHAIPDLIAVVAIFVVFRWLVRLSDRFFDGGAAGTSRTGWVHPELVAPTRRLVRILLWSCALVIAYPHIPGSQSKAFEGFSILIAVMVSFGSGGMVGNLVAGMVLVYARTFRVGDRVLIGQHLGDVESLGMFATKLRSIRNEEVTLLNGLVVTVPIVNYTRLEQEAGLVLHTQVTIGYDAKWRTVHALLIEAASGVEGVEREPVPWVYQRALNDHHISYEICCVTRRSHEHLALYSRLHEAIQDAFARAGVEILSPAYTSVRDANAPVLPDEPAGPRAEPGGFRIHGRRHE